MNQPCPKCNHCFIEIMESFYTLDMAFKGVDPHCAFRCVNCGTIWRTWATACK